MSSPSTSEFHSSRGSSTQKRGNEKTVKERRPSSVLVAQVNIEMMHVASSNSGSQMHNSNNSTLFHSSNPSNPRRRTWHPSTQNNSSQTNNSSQINNSQQQSDPVLVNQGVINQLMTNQPTQPSQKSPKKFNNNNLSQSPPAYIKRKQSHAIMMNNIKFSNLQSTSSSSSSPSSPTSPTTTSSTTNILSTGSFSFPFSRQSVSRPLPANRPRSYARIVKDDPLNQQA